MHAYVGIAALHAIGYMWVDVMAYWLICLPHELLCIPGMAAGYIEVSAKLFLDEFMKMLGLNPPSITGWVGQDGRSIVSIRVALGLVDDARSLYHEATRVTKAEAKQAASLMVIHALANVRQVETRDINFPQV